MSAGATVGAPRPRPWLSNELLGTLYFLGAEAMFFLGLVFVALSLRRQSGAWPPAGSPPADLGLLALNTAVLLASGVTMLAARRAVARADGGGLVRWLAVTVTLGAAFLAGQVAAFARLGGWRPAEGMYRTLFDVVSGLHGLHVLAGLVLLGVVLGRARLGQFSGGRHVAVVAAAWYWTFVAAVWLVLLAALVLG